MEGIFGGLLKAFYYAGLSIMTTLFGEKIARKKTAESKCVKLGGFFYGLITAVIITVFLVLEALNSGNKHLVVIGVMLMPFGALSGAIVAIILFKMKTDIEEIEQKVNDYE